MLHDAIVDHVDNHAGLFIGINCPWIVVIVVVAKLQWNAGHGGGAPRSEVAQYTS
jgi:hypothetical protein